MSFDNHDLPAESKPLGGADAPTETSANIPSLALTSWNDAEVIGAHCPEWEDILDTTIHVTPGIQFSKHPDKRKSTKDDKWDGVPMTWRELIEGSEGVDHFFAEQRRETWGLSRHKASKNKEGSGFVFANCQKHRRSNAVTSVSALVLDVDTGHFDFDTAVHKVEAFGRAAVLATSYNHMNDELWLGFDSVVDFAKCDGQPSEEQIKAYLREKQGYADHIVESAEVIEMPAQTPEGWKIHLKVSPIPKLRIIFMLAEGDVELINLANKQSEAQKVFKDKIIGLSEALGIPTDPATVDVARIFYSARHKQGKEHRIAIVQGPPLSFTEVPAPSIKDGTNKHLSPTKDTARPSAFKPAPVYLSCGFNLIAWSAENGEAFKVVEFMDALGWEFRSGGVSLQTAEILCPNDDQHSDAGNPNDKGCYVRNPIGGEGFKFSCRHAHCQNLPKLEMLALMEGQTDLPDGWDSFANLLCSGEFYVDGKQRDQSEYRDGAATNKVHSSDGQPTPESIRAACQKMIKKAKISKKFSANSGKVAKKVSKEGGDVEWITICDPFEVVGRTYSENGDSQGLIVRFAADRNRSPIFEETISKEMLANDPRKVIAQLVDRGLWVMASSDARSAVPELLSSIREVPDIITVTQPGWHDEVFVSPSGEYFSNNDAEYRLTNKLLLKRPVKSGTLEGWLKSTTAALECANADLLSIGLISGFAGCIVNLLNVPVSPILNFAGTTTRGKTTAQRLGASVWANPLKGGLLQKFNASDNAIENIAVQASGTVLALDEGGQAARDSAQFQATVFKLAEGSGKTRMSPSGEARDIKTWTTCFTISEEVGFGDKVKREDANAAAGAVARCWEISFSETQELDLKTTSKIDAVAENFGWAGPIFVQHVIDKGYHKSPDLVQARIDKASYALLSGVKDFQPQYRRLAASAALLQVAGEIAQEAGLVTATFNVHEAVKRVLTGSLESMSGAMNPKATALINLREGILRRIGVDVVEINEAETSGYREVSAYYGYKSPTGNFDTKQGNREGLPQPPADRIYCVPVGEMLKISGGMTKATLLASELKKQGYLIPQSKNNNQWETIPGIGGIKHYRISGEFFHAESDPEAADAADEAELTDVGIAAE